VAWKGSSIRPASPEQPDLDFRQVYALRQRQHLRAQYTSPNLFVKPFLSPAETSLKNLIDDNSTDWDWKGYCS
jgi:hypothetical protein